VWELAEKSGDPDNKAEAVRAACDCPTGRLTALEKDGSAHEHAYEPSIDILQDPEKAVSSGIFVKGGIPIEAADGTMYETRNRAVLCRCGQSRNKPFCDATHVVVDFIDGQNE
jgi:CDGSH-type Zn-finger protein